MKSNSISSSSVKDFIGYIFSNVYQITSVMGISIVYQVWRGKVCDRNHTHHAPKIHFRCVSCVVIVHFEDNYKVPRFGARKTLNNC